MHCHCSTWDNLSPNCSCLFLPCWWNKQPNAIRAVASLSIFKNLFTLHFFTWSEHQLNAAVRNLCPVHMNNNYWNCPPLRGPVPSRNLIVKCVLVCVCFFPLYTKSGLNQHCYLMAALCILRRQKINKFSKNNLAEGKLHSKQSCNPTKKKKPCPFISIDIIRLWMLKEKALAQQ